MTMQIFTPPCQHASKGPAELLSYDTFFTGYYHHLSRLSICRVNRHLLLGIDGAMAIAAMLVNKQMD